MWFQQRPIPLHEAVTQSFSRSDDLINGTLKAPLHSQVYHYAMLSSLHDAKAWKSFASELLALSTRDQARALLSNQATLMKPLLKTNQQAIEYVLQPLVHELLNGAVVIQAEDGSLYSLPMLQVHTGAVKEATVESVIQGTHIAFSEHIEVNVNLIRSRYKQPSLTMLRRSVGTRSHTAVTLLFDESAVDPAVVTAIEQKLDSIRHPMIQSLGQLQNELSTSKYNLFPQYLLTERPDRAVLNIMQGKVIVLIEGTAFCLVLPTVFQDFISSMEDLSQPFWSSKFIVALRYFGYLLCILLPAVYVGVTAYNTELFRLQLVLSIASSRSTVPYPAFIEVLLMLLMMELLTEASIRLPKTVGPTATTVGGLILGEAATKAGLVSNIIVIIVATVAISNFVIPTNSMSYAVRLVKYILLVPTMLLGIVGIMFGLIGLAAYLVHLQSMGVPYFQIQLAQRTNQLSTTRSVMKS